MKKLSQKEKETLLRFIERNVKNGPDPENLDEGIGTVYERVVVDEYFREMVQKYQIKTVLETPADGVTGVPGINSLEFARNGAFVVLTNPSALMLENAKKVWQREGLLKKVEFIQCEVDELPFKDREFDLVWNYCMFERFQNPEIILSEMKRVSKRYLYLLTQNAHNFGTPLHYLYHKANQLEWDHGDKRLMKLKTIIKILNKNQLEILEAGAIDAPPWLDTWDMPLRGELKKILTALGLKWEWQTKEKQSKDSRLLRFFVWIEKNLPRFFLFSQTHHFHLLTQKKKEVT